MSTRNLCILLLLALIDGITCQQCSVKDHGARGDGKHDDTNDIESAIHSSKCNPVYFPMGTYRVGSMALRDNKVYIMEPGAKLVADPSTDKLNDYGLFTGNNLYNMTFYNINIDLLLAANNGGTVWGLYCTGCAKLQFNNLSIYNPNVTNCNGLKCITCENIFIQSSLLQGHAGLDCMSCKDMAVYDTEIKGGDDGLALKGSAKNITFINGTYWSTTCNAVILGSETFDEFVNISIINAYIPMAGKGVFL